MAAAVGAAAVYLQSFFINIFPLSFAAFNPRLWLSVKTNVAAGWQTPAAGEVKTKNLPVFPALFIQASRARTHTTHTHAHPRLYIYSHLTSYLFWAGRICRLQTLWTRFYCNCVLRPLLRVRHIALKTHYFLQNKANKNLNKQEIVSE